MKRICAKISFFFVVFISVIYCIKIIVITIFTPQRNTALRKNLGTIILKNIKINLQVQGKADLEAKLYILNHQSFCDIAIFEHYMPQYLAWIAKKELCQIPIVGKMIKQSKIILVDRNSQKDAKKMLKAVKEKLSQNHPITIFPEGTRGNGEKLLPFKEGAALIGNMFNLKIQPVVIIGSKKAIDTKNMQVNSTDVKLVFLPSFQANKTRNWLSETKEKMQQILDQHNKALT